MENVSGSGVLIVDDAEANIDILVEALSDIYEVSVATDGKSALEAVRGAPPDVILLDILMPGMDGYEVCRCLKEDRATRSVPIIFVTSLAQIERKEQGFELGAVDYITKPFEIKEVRARIHAHLSQKKARESVERIAHQNKAAREAMDRELEIGGQVQASFFPESLPRVPGWEIAAHFQPARRMGGDFYDAFPLFGGQAVGLVVADVCDKGVGAALFMGLFRSLIRTFASMYESGNGMSLPVEPLPAVRDASRDRRLPAGNLFHAEALKRIITSTNDYIAENHGRLTMFATLFFGILDTATATLTYINAGNEAPALIGSYGVKKFLDPTGPALGLFPDLTFEVGRTEFEPGDTVVAYTDGITEACNPQEELFGSVRLQSLFLDPVLSATELLQRITRSVSDHAEGVALSDDRPYLRCEEQKVKYRIDNDLSKVYHSYKTCRGQYGRRLKASSILEMISAR